MSEMADQDLKKIYNQKKEAVASELSSLIKEIAINIDIRKNEIYKEVISK